MLILYWIKTKYHMRYQLNLLNSGRIINSKCSEMKSCELVPVLTVAEEKEDIWKHKTDILPPLMQGRAAHPGECDAEQAGHDLDLLELFLKHGTGTADGAALHLKITSLPDKNESDLIIVWRAAPSVG